MSAVRTDRQTTIPNSRGAEPHGSSVRDMRRAQIAASSPEGLPAHPGIRVAGTIALFAVALGAIVIAALALALSGRVALAFGVVPVGMIVLALFNPVTWAAIARARERARIQSDSYESATGDVTRPRTAPAAPQH